MSVFALDNSIDCQPVKTIDQNGVCLLSEKHIKSTFSFLPFFVQQEYNHILLHGPPLISIFVLFYYESIS